jgi:hypothetical protein
MTSYFTNADADRLLGFADQFIEDMENDDDYDIDSDERESIGEYRQIRPLLVAAPRMFETLKSAQIVLETELQPKAGTRLHELLADIRSAIAQTKLVQSGQALYWNHQGKYQKEYQQFSKLIPQLGTCRDPYLEALRLVCNWYYDVLNNGGCNHCYPPLSPALRSIGVDPDQYSFSQRRHNPDLDRLVDAIMEKLIERQGLYFLQEGSGDQLA